MATTKIVTKLLKFVNRPTTKLVIFRYFFKNIFQEHTLKSYNLFYSKQWSQNVIEKSVSFLLIYKWQQLDATFTAFEISLSFHRNWIKNKTLISLKFSYLHIQVIFFCISSKIGLKLIYIFRNIFITFLFKLSFLINVWVENIFDLD